MRDDFFSDGISPKGDNSDKIYGSTDEGENEFFGHDGFLFKYTLPSLEIVSTTAYEDNEKNIYKKYESPIE